MRCLTAFGRDTSGNATMEFVVLFPFLLYMIFTIAEVGVLMTRTVMLDRGLDIAVRDLRLGLLPGATHDDIKTIICEGAFLLGECEDTVMLNLEPLTDYATFVSTGGDCVDRTSEIEPTTTFTPGAESEIMFVRACLVVDPLFPGSGIGAMLPKDASGGYRIIAKSAFMNEPG
jgi:hypothetical protein